MKTYDQLTPEQQQKAVQYFTNQILTDIVENGLRFNDKLNNNDLQARIDAAGDKAEQMQTPWFWHGYIMDTCKDDIIGMATVNAEESLYSEPDEFVTSLSQIDRITLDNA